MADRAPERIELAPGYSISRIINGGWQLSLGHRLRGSLDQVESIRGMWQLAESGLTTFDCADIYTGVEELIGRFLSEWRESGASPEDIQVHTKFVPDRSALAGLSRQDTAAIVDRSLRRLGVDCLDLVQFHWWDYKTPGMVEAARWLDDLRRAGKIRHIGLTNFDVAGTRAILDAGVPLVSNQVQYSLLDRRPENGMQDLCRAGGMRLLCYGGLAGGLLTDRYRGQPDPGDAAETRSVVKYRLIVDEFGGWDSYQALLHEMRSAADSHGVLVANVALRFVLQQPGVGAVIVGAPNARHLSDNLGTFGFSLSDGALAELRRVVGEAGPQGDCFGLERIPGGKHASIMKTDLNRED